ncbi:YchJ family metal-binding protein [Leucobacter sp. L43]|uniref:YchJ family protein n=1 Tax=Leucobacter sp. L43 TaxID=2798040 RepID=UPI0019063707
MTAQPCPCGRGVDFAECCAPLHAGDRAPTAERLMRSRYSAFAVGDAQYLLTTWDPSTRPASLDLDDGTAWQRLFVEHTTGGGPFDDTGLVTYTAVARGPEGRIELRERSRFRRSGPDHRWVYVDGDML